MPSSALLLAYQSASDKSSRLFAEVLPWLIVLIVAVLVGGVVLYIVRRRLQQEAGPGAAGFTLQDLRNLHASGELSDEEYARAKAQMIGRLKSPPTDANPAINRKPGPESGPRKPPGNSVA